MKLKIVTAWLAAIALLILYIYATIAAAGNFAGMSRFVGDLFGPLQMALLVINLAAPALMLLLVLPLMRKRSAWLRVLLLAAGLSVVAAIQLEIMHLIS